MKPIQRALAVTLVFVSVDALATETQIPVAESARFFAINREGSATHPILSYRREGSSGVSYGKREFDCQAGATRYLAYGDTAEMADPGYPEPEMYPVVPGSSAWSLAKFACGN
jgi:hypothetical protein